MSRSATQPSRVRALYARTSQLSFKTWGLILLLLALALLFAGFFWWDTWTSLVHAAWSGTTEFLRDRGNATATAATPDSNLIIIRNLGLILAGIFGFGLALWRGSCRPSSTRRSKRWPPNRKKATHNTSLCSFSQTLEYMPLERAAR